MSILTIIAIILYIIVLVGLFYAPPAFGNGLKCIAAICGLIMLLMIFRVIH